MVYRVCQGASFPVDTRETLVVSVVDLRSGHFSQSRPVGVVGHVTIQVDRPIFICLKILYGDLFFYKNKYDVRQKLLRRIRT